MKRIWMLLLMPLLLAGSVRGAEAALPKDLDPAELNQAALAHQALPEFLNEEQRLVYRRAMALWEMLYINSENIDWYGEWLAPHTEGNAAQQKYVMEVMEDAQGQKNVDLTYFRARGVYAHWGSFEKACLSAFTPEYFASLIQENDVPRFIEKDGAVWYLPGGHFDDDSYAPYSWPDTFELEKQTENQIDFSVTCHSSFLGDAVTPVTPRVKRISLQMVRTEQGWRFSRFGMGIQARTTIEPGWQ